MTVAGDMFANDGEIIAIHAPLFATLFMATQASYAWGLAKMLV